MAKGSKGLVGAVTSLASANKAVVIVAAAGTGLWALGEILSAPPATSAKDATTWYKVGAFFKLRPKVT